MITNNIFTMFFVWIRFFLSFFSETKTIKEEVVKVDPIDEYKKAYYDKFNRLEKKSIDLGKLNNLKISFMHEFTPLGPLVMYYDSESDSFNYYCDKNLSYAFLDTACRKYVTLFDCKVLYVEIDEQLKKIEARKEEEKNERNEIIEEKIEDEKSKLYIKPKKYNVKKKPKSRATIIDNKEKINNFKYCGILREFKFLNNEECKKVKNTVKNISFSEFKNRSNIYEESI